MIVNGEVSKKKKKRRKKEDSTKKTNRQKSALNIMDKSAQTYKSLFLQHLIEAHPDGGTMGSGGDSQLVVLISRENPQHKNKPPHNSPDDIITTTTMGPVPLKHLLPDLLIVLAWTQTIKDPDGQPVSLRMLNNESRRGRHDVCPFESPRSPGAHRLSLVL